MPIRVHNWWPLPRLTKERYDDFCPPPFKIGYARVSTNTQDEALQVDALQRACVDRVFIDHASGSV